MFDLLPPPLPERGKFKALYSWLNRLRAAVRAQRPLESYNTLTSFTSAGVHRRSLGGKGEQAEPVTLQFKEQWQATTSYEVNDLVHCDTTEEIDTGVQAGFYRCTSAITGNASNAHPSADTTHWMLEARAHWSKLTIASTIPDTGVIILSAAATNGHEVRLREWNVCVDGTMKKVLVLASDVYT